MYNLQRSTVHSSALSTAATLPRPLDHGPPSFLILPFGFSSTAALIDDRYLMGLESRAVDGPWW